MRSTLIVTLLAFTAGASAATVDDICSTVAAQESAEAWPGVDAREAGLPPGAAVLIVGDLCGQGESSPETALSAADLALVMEALALVERPGDESALDSGTLPPGSADVLRLALARIGVVAALHEAQARLEQIDARLPQ